MQFQLQNVEKLSIRSLFKLLVRKNVVQIGGRVREKNEKNRKQTVLSKIGVAFVCKHVSAATSVVIFVSELREK